MNDTVSVMKRVNAILQACRDDARLRSRVAEETAKWVRSKDTNIDRDFNEFLRKLEHKFDILPPTKPVTATPAVKVKAKRKIK